MLLTKLPGVALAAAVGVACVVVAQFLPTISALLLSIAIGIAVGSLRLVPQIAVPGIAWSSKRLLRAGIVLLGLQLSLSSLVSLGLGGIAVLVATIVVTFFGTLAIGRVLRVERVTRYLIATGFAICGASAIAAMSSIIDPRNESDEEVAQSVALVTLYGTAALFVLPALTPLIGLDDREAGLWIGASVHEVAQVVAAASAVSALALATATIAKLGRVVMLAPLVALVGLREALVARRAPDTNPDATPTKRPPIIPLFVLGFLALVVVRTLLPVPAEVLQVTSLVTTVLLAVAMFGMGTGVDLRKLVRTGGRPAALGAASTIVAAGVSLVGILLIRGLS